MHGGALSEATRIYGAPADGLLDLSTGINAEAYPLAPLHLDALRRLPDPSDLARLEAIAAEAYGSRAACLAAPGTQAILHALPGIVPATDVAIVSPTYSGHAEGWAAHGVAPRPIADLGGDAAVTILVNPNNPDGLVVARARILASAEQAAASGRLIVVDEAFADMVPETSVADRAGPGLLVLRSFGKAYGLAGLRLGFALGDTETIASLRRRLGDWAVSGPALHAGRAALPDRAWLEAARGRAAQRCARLGRMLKNAGFSPVGDTPLFRLVAHEAAADIHARLAHAGVWTRRFPEHPSWLRFGVPGDADFPRLEAALAALRRGA